MLPPLFLGIDVGTQSVRAALVDARGYCHAQATSPLTTTLPAPTWAEQEPGQWWSALGVAVRQALDSLPGAAEATQAIGLDSTACTVLASSLDGTALAPALLWMDQRAHREAEAINSTADPSLRWVSGVVSPEWMLPKALWLKRHRRDVYDRADRLVECTDWLMYHLTGAWTLSLNHVAVKWNHVRPEGGWSRPLLRAVDLDDLPGKWPERIIPLGRGDGRLSPRAAAHLGLREGLPVAQGGVDAYLGMLGLGAVRPGDLAMILGSSTCHLAMSREPLLGSGMLGCYPDAVEEGTYTLEGGQTATGSILNWFRQHFGHGATFEEHDALAAAVPAGCEGLICLDYWQGNRCPHKDPRARGVFWGLTLAHGAGHLYRAICEATACGTRAILDDVAGHGLRIDRVFAGGGGVRSRLWMQIHADVLGRPIHLPAESEACALGSALAAAVHAGAFADLDEAAASMVRIAEVIDPRPEAARVYGEVYARYRDTYPALRELMHRDAPV
jgi:ribulokinase